MGIRRLLGTVPEIDESSAPAPQMPAQTAPRSRPRARAAAGSSASSTASAGSPAVAATATKAAAAKPTADKTDPAKAASSKAPAVEPMAASAAKSKRGKVPATAAPTEAAPAKARTKPPAKARTKPPKTAHVPALRPAWTTAEQTEIRRELEVQARELQAEIDAADAASQSRQRDEGTEGSGDEADAGSKTFEREQEMSLANNSRDLLLQVERALARLDEGTYGGCESCGTAIPKARLQAFPRATLCVACKQREERR